MKDKMQLHDTIVKIIDELIRSAPKLAYHNAYHALDVWNMARQYAIMENLPYKDRTVLEPAALLHDIIYVPGSADNEQRSADYAKIFLTKIGYPYAKEAAELILSTKLSITPATTIEKILSDADYNNLGRDDFLETSKTLQEELGIEDDRGWYLSSLRLLQTHQYHTASARALRDKGKQKNLEKLESAEPAM